MKPLHHDLGPLVDGLIRNFDDQAHWNAVEDFCRDHEMAYQVACFDYIRCLDRTQAYWDSLPPEQANDLSKSTMFKWRTDSREIIFVPYLWNYPWFEQHRVDTVLCRGYFPQNARCLGRIFATYIMGLMNTKLWNVRRQAVCKLAAMKLIDHKTRDYWLRIEGPIEWIYQSSSPNDIACRMARSGTFGSIQRLIYEYHNAFRCSVQERYLLCAEALVRATQQWVKDYIKDQQQWSR